MANAFSMNKSQKLLLSMMQPGLQSRERVAAILESKETKYLVELMDQAEALDRKVLYAALVKAINAWALQNESGSPENKER